MNAGAVLRLLKAAFVPDEWTGVKGPNNGVRVAFGATVPTDATSGYETGCIFVHTDGTGEDIFYINVGSVTSCNFDGFEIGLQATYAAHTHVFTGTALTDLDLNVMDDDTAATNGTKVYLAQERGKAQEGVLWSEMANEASVYIEDATNAVRFPVIHKVVEDPVLKCTDDDSAASNGVALYVVLTGEQTPWGADIGVFQCVNVGNADSDFDVATPTDTFDVFDNDGAATAGPMGLDWSFAIYVDEDAATATSRLLTNNTVTGHDIYVRSQAGRYIKVTHNADPGTPGVQVYFDDDAATETNRLLFVSPTNADMTDGACGHQLGLFAVDGWWVSPVYFDDDAATESARLLCAISAAENSYVYAIEANRMVQITYSATPQTPGVLLYIDDDAVAEDERLLAVNAGDADSTVQLSPTYTIFGTVAAGSNAVPA